MHITLYKALLDANIDDVTAQRVVAALEDHIERTIENSMAPLEAQVGSLRATGDAKLGSIETKVEAGNKGTQTSLDGLKWFLILTNSALVAITAYTQIIRLPTGG